MYSWTHVCWMCVRLFYILFLFFMLGIFVLEKVVDIFLIRMVYLYSKFSD